MAQGGMNRRYDVVVVGGGLAGLTAATLLAREGRSVIVFERASKVGGRAVTREANGFHFNLGPHALYRAGAALPILRELGIPVRGKIVPTAAGKVVLGGRLHSPIRAALTSRMLRVAEKVEMIRFLRRLRTIDPTPLDRTLLGVWATEQFRSTATRALFLMLARVATYAADVEHHSAGAAIAQTRRALQSGVLYLDGGWQTLVDALASGAEAAGVTIIRGARVVAIEHDLEVSGARLADGTLIEANAAILAVSPEEATRLIRGGAEMGFGRWAAMAEPIRASVLDVGLAHLPVARNLVVLGIDQPLYLSVHSRWAALAPNGGATIHVAKYLAPHTDGATAQELEGLLDLAQPGWREHLVERRFYSRLTVSNALVTADMGGTAGRPGPNVPEVPGLYLAGDWVGATGMLADAAVASARQAAMLAARESHPRSRETVLHAAA
jgi:phytoene dehydrogenase-like protein